MKKLFITLAFVAATFFCQAQLYVGGSLGFSGATGFTTTTSSTSSIDVTVNMPKYFTFSITPVVGYMLTDNLAAGLGFGLAFDNMKYSEDVMDVTYTVKEKETSWIVAPWLRYFFADFKDIRLYADFRVGFGGSKPKNIVEGDSTTVENVGDKEFDFGVGVIPGIAYYLNDHISINTRLNLLSVGYSMTKVTSEEIYGNETFTTVNKYNDFGLGVNMPTAIEVGFYYTF
ncbi:MAG: outer membrane beta-barrel protein [Candidatus Limimorpha sp.]